MGSEAAPQPEWKIRAKRRSELLSRSMLGVGVDIDVGVVDVGVVVADVDVGQNDAQRFRAATVRGEFDRGV